MNGRKFDHVANHPHCGIRRALNSRKRDSHVIKKTDPQKRTRSSVKVSKMVLVALTPAPSFGSILQLYFHKWPQDGATEQQIFNFLGATPSTNLFQLQENKFSKSKNPSMNEPLYFSFFYDLKTQLKYKISYYLSFISSFISPFIPLNILLSINNFSSTLYIFSA